MIHLELTPETIEELLHENSTIRILVSAKMEVLYYRSQGMPHQEICKYSNIRGHATLARYFRQYQKGGLNQLRQLGSPAQRVISCPLSLCSQSGVVMMDKVENSANMIFEFLRER